MLEGGAYKDMDACLMFVDFDAKFIHDMCANTKRRQVPPCTGTPAFRESELESGTATDGSRIPWPHVSKALLVVLLQVPDA